MENKTTYNFDSKKCLPSNIIIKSAGNHFYRIGLANYSYGAQNRSILFNPILVTFVMCLAFIRYAVSLTLSDENLNVIIMIGDFSQFLKIRQHFCVLEMQIYLLAVILQVLHLTKYNNHLKPSYMKPFEMMSGLISPKNIGLTDKSEIYRMITKAKLLFAVLSFNINCIVPVLAISLSTLPMMCCCTAIQIILFVIPWSLFFTAAGIYVISIICWQCVYFYLICYYLKLRIKHVNNAIKVVIQQQYYNNNNNNNKLNSLLHTLDCLYTDIIDYNNNYWSQFIFFLCSILSSVICFCLYSTLFAKTEYSVQIIMIYPTLIFMFVLILFLLMSSSLTEDVYKSFNLFNKLSIKCIRNMSFTQKIKLLSVIERIGEKRIGFYCGTLFIITNFRSYQLFALMAAYFIKLIDVSAPQLTNY